MYESPRLCSWEPKNRATLGPGRRCVGSVPGSQNVPCKVRPRFADPVPLPFGQSGGWKLRIRPLDEAAFGYVSSCCGLRDAKPGARPDQAPLRAWISPFAVLCARIYSKRLQESGRFHLNLQMWIDARKKGNHLRARLCPDCQAVVLPFSTYPARLYIEDLKAGHRVLRTREEIRFKAALSLAADNAFSSSVDLFPLSNSRLRTLSPVFGTRLRIDRGCYPPPTSPPCHRVSSWTKFHHSGSS